MPKFTVMTACLLGLFTTAILPGPVFAADESEPPKNAEMKKAKALIDKKDLKPAVPLLKAALANEPNNADAWNLMGYTHRKLGQVDQAFGFYQKALAINANHLGALEYLGELYLQTGRLKEAEEMLKRLDDACLFGCEEYDDLKKALKSAKAID